MKISDNSRAKLRSRVKDTLFDGELICWQYRQGYRFSIDSVLLAHLAPVKKESTILDLGTGCGVLGLILLYRYNNNYIHVTGIEKQADLAELARLNITSNNFTPLFHLVPGDVSDIRSLFKPESFSLVISNPPYYSLNSGRPSSTEETLVARHQELKGLELFIDGAAYCLKNRCRVVFIYPAHLLSAMVVAMKKKNLEPKSIQFIYSYPDVAGSAALVVVEGMKNGGEGVLIPPPFYIYECKKGPYTPATASFYQPNPRGGCHARKD